MGSGEEGAGKYLYENASGNISSSVNTSSFFAGEEIDEGVKSVEEGSGKYPY